MLEGWVDHFSSTPTISNLRACKGYLPLAKEGRSTSILKHIGMLEEDELEDTEELDYMPDDVELDGRSHKRDRRRVR